ncbi:MAG TPA: hypothetical protein VGG74_18885 [Kofleriaceae bacterium]|jgi:hypothetical protein
MRVVAAVCAIALLAAAMLGSTWFHVRVDDPIVSFVAGFRIDLRAMSACSPDGECAAMPLAQLPGGFPLAAVAAFWTGAATIVLVATQIVVRRRALAYLGIGVAIGCAIAVVLAAYVVAPSPSDFGSLATRVEPTLAPVVMLVGVLAAIAAMWRSRAVRGAAPVSDPDRLPATPLTPHRMVAVEPPPKRPAREP